jgi:hypothetical protein
MAAKLAGFGLLFAGPSLLAGELPVADTPPAPTAASVAGPCLTWTAAQRHADNPAPSVATAPEPPPPIPHPQPAALGAGRAPGPDLPTAPTTPTKSFAAASAAVAQLGAPVATAAVAAGPVAAPAAPAQVLPAVPVAAAQEQAAVDVLPQLSPPRDAAVSLKVSWRPEGVPAQTPVSHPVRPSDRLICWGTEAQQPPGTQRMPRAGAGQADEETQGYTIQLEPPGTERLFRLESEANFQNRLIQEALGRPRPERIEFPVETPVSTEAYTGRRFPPMGEVVEPTYLCYQRLYFEEKNSERYGWDLGFIQPFVSAGAFWWDLVTLPYHIGTEPCRKFECSAGYCLPGDPVPYLIYPPEFSITGTVLEAGTIVALFAIFPG